MELIIRELDVDRILDGSAMQALIEGEVPLPESHARLLRSPEVLLSNGRLSIDDATVEDGAATLAGTVSADVICEEGGEVFAFTTATSFKQRMELPAAKAGMRASAKGCLQTMEVERAEGGRLMLRAVADISCALTGGGALRVLDGIRGVGDVEFCHRDVSAAETKKYGSVMIRIRDDLPSQGAESVLLCSAAAQAREVYQSGGNALVEGTVSYSALVRAREDRLTMAVYHVPFTAEVEMDGAAGGSELFASVEARESSLRTVGEDTGLICAEAVLSVTVFGRELRTVTLPSDAYSPTTPFVCKYGEFRHMLRGSEQCGRQVISESISIPEGMPDAARTVYVGARAIVTGASAQGHELRAEGLLFTRVIYQSEGGTLFAFSEDIPYVLTLPTQKECDCAASADVNVLFITASGSGRSIDVGYNIAYCARTECESAHGVVSGIEECGACETGHGVVIYYAGRGETLFDVGKTFNVARSRLRDANPDVGDELTEGQRVLMLI